MRIVVRVLARAFAAAPAVAPAVALVVTAALAGCRDTATPVRLGLAGPFTDPIGRPMLLAARLAAAEINGAGGLGGRRVELVERDDHGDADSAVAIARDFADDPTISAVVGHVFSGTTLAAAPLYNDAAEPVVAISPSSSAPEVSNAGDYIFRVCPSDLAHGAALARWAREGLGLSRGTVLYLNDEYGRGVRRRFVEEYRRRGGSVLESAPYLGDTPHVEPYIERMARDGRSEFVLVAGNRGEAETVLRAAQARGLRLPLLGADGLEGIEAAGPLAEGTYLSLAYLPGVSTAANQRFVEAYRRTYAREGLPNQPAAAAYDVVRLLGEVIGEAGTGRAAIRNALAARGPERPYEGVTGSIAFDSLGDVPNQKVYIAVVRGGALQLAGEQ